MKRLLCTGLALALACLLGGGAWAQSQSDPTQSDLIAKRDKKLKKPFLTKAAWITDYDVARKKAKESNKLIFAYFTRSYAP